jgi:hypothetical protein
MEAIAGTGGLSAAQMLLSVFRLKMRNAAIIAMTTAMKSTVRKFNEQPSAARLVSGGLNPAAEIADRNKLPSRAERPRAATNGYFGVPPRHAFGNIYTQSESRSTQGFAYTKVSLTQ